MSKPNLVKNQPKDKPLFDLEGMIQNWLNELVVSNKNDLAGAVARKTSGEGARKFQREFVSVREHHIIETK